MGACTGREETNHATNHHRNAPQPLSARLGLSAVRGIRYRHNRRAEASSTGKSTAISAFPFTRITDSAWQAANHAAKAWRFIPLHPSLARSLPLPPLLPRSSSSRSSRVRERERSGRRARAAFLNSARASPSRTRAIHFDGERAAKIFRAGDGRFVRGSPVSQ